MKNTQVYNHLKHIFFSAVERVDPYKMIKNSITLKENMLNIEIENKEMSLELERFNRIFVIGAGKATAKMAKAIEEIFSGKITEGIIAVKYGHTEPMQSIKTIEAGHPVPDENSIKAAIEIEKISRLTDDKTLFLNLISGGGSALLTSPIRCSIGSETIQLTLDDIQRTTKVLLSCGAPIDEMNCIRKHLSNIKGGKLARLLYPATQVNIILSDVVGDKLDTIASGLTTFDDTTYKHALKIVNKYKIQEKIPLKVLKVLKSGADGLIEETPKRNDPVFSRVHNILIGTNYTALIAASKKAQSLGYNTAVLSSQITGEARETARIFFGIAKDIKEHNLLLTKPGCVIGGGETTVTLRGAGKGGRNQELALSFLSEMQKNNEQTEDIYFLSASTDGNDGPTDAAGAFASLNILKESKRKSLNIEEYLNNNDSYNFFKKAGYLLKTGPTNTNVCDIQVAIVK